MEHLSITENKHQVQPVIVYTAEHDFNVIQNSLKSTFIICYIEHPINKDLIVHI